MAKTDAGIEETRRASLDPSLKDPFNRIACIYGIVVLVLIGRLIAPMVSTTAEVDWRTALGIMAPLMLAMAWPFSKITFKYGKNSMKFGARSERAAVLNDEPKTLEPKTLKKVAGRSETKKVAK